MTSEWTDGAILEEVTYFHGKLVFSQPLRLSLRENAGRWEASLVRPSRETILPNGNSWEVAEQLILTASHEEKASAVSGLFDLFGETASRLIQSMSHLLSEEDLRLKGLILSCIALLESDIVGIEYPEDRWFLAERKENRLVVKDRDEPFEFDLPPGVSEDVEMLMCRLKIYRCGTPKTGEPVMEFDCLDTTTPIEVLLQQFRDRCKKD